MYKLTVCMLGLAWLGSAALGEAQIYGYTDDNGVLILSNVPTDDRMRMIADGIAEPASKVWRYTGQYDSMILKASRIHGVESALVRAVTLAQATQYLVRRAGLDQKTRAQLT